MSFKYFAYGSGKCDAHRTEGAMNRIFGAGAVQALIDEYVEWIRAVQSIEDPNPKRRAENEALLLG